jgi:hypothetical protein
VEEPNHKSLSEELSDAIIVLADIKLPTPQDAMLKLESLGHSRLVAEKLYLFVETAFGRVLIERLANVVFSETYIVESADGKQTEYVFADDAYHEHAFHLAYSFVENRSQEKARDVVLAIGSRSAELSVFSKAFESGLDTEGSVFAPLRWNSALPASAWESFSR